MATTVNAQGVASDFVINNETTDDNQNEATTPVVAPNADELAKAKAALKAAKDAVKLAKGETIRPRGRQKQYHFERSPITAQIPKDDYIELMKHFKTPTEALNTLVSDFLAAKADKADKQVG